MEVLTIGLSTFAPAIKPRISACLGYFDGVHLAHQALIKKTVALAEHSHSKTAMITFYPDPASVLFPQFEKKHITSEPIKQELVSALGVDLMILLDFTKEMADLCPKDFAHLLNKHFTITALVCGFDFSYGQNGKGTAETLTNDFPDTDISIIPPKIHLGEKISSTQIAGLIKGGKIGLANRLLGHPFTLEGVVIPGRQKGRTIGFPTANLRVDPKQLLPKPGIYLGLISFEDQKKMAIINLGHNPTMNKRTDLSLEAHLLDYQGDLYGKTLKLEFYHYQRSEKHFSSIEKLVAQLTHDTTQCRNFFLKRGQDMV
ncbi:MAG: riboflavin biosynthesis protein RibF [Erysipelotrichaceae bacterium]|jgi:riboflavin kinase/FMN adenylyltransferase|nr:riboflavin biosynthesis protein RibF [Erysipelotrichaceae bacterium]